MNKAHPAPAVAGQTPVLTQGTRELDTGSFGAGVSVPLVPQVSAFTERAEDPRVWRQFLLGGGSVAVVDGEAVLSSSTGLYAYSVIQTVANVAYQPGSGLRLAWTARFPTPGVAGSLIAAGPYHGEAGFAVGYDETTFGFMFRRGRRFEIQKLTLSVPAAGAETVTITLNDTAHAVPVTAGTVAHNAREIAEFASGYFDSAGFVAYDVTAIDGVVYFQRETHGNAAGAFSATSSGALVGAFVEWQAGADGTQTWTPQADWSIDPCDGFGPSRIILDPTYGNVYLITWGWLGYLGALLWVSDPETQRFVKVHFEPWGGTAAATGPMIADPRLPYIYAVASLGSTTDLSVAGASVYGALEGGSVRPGPSLATSRVVASVSATEAPVLAMQCSPVGLRNQTINRRRINIAGITFSNTGAKDATVRVYIGTPANLTGYNFQQLTDDAVLIDLAATALAGTPTQIEARNIPAGGSGSIADHPFELYRGQVLIITAQTSTSTTSAVVTIDGHEDP